MFLNQIFYRKCYPLGIINTTYTNKFQAQHVLPTEDQALLTRAVCPSIGVDFILSNLFTAADIFGRDDRTGDFSSSKSSRSPSPVCGEVFLAEDGGFLAGVGLMSWLTDFTVGFVAVDVGEDLFPFGFSSLKKLEFVKL